MAARRIVARGEFGISTQVLQEFYVNITAPKAEVPIPYAAELVERLMSFPCAVIDPDVVMSAIAVARRYRINYWDAAIIAAAIALGAPVLYSEDLNHNQNYGGVRVVNPFV